MVPVDSLGSAWRVPRLGADFDFAAIPFRLRFLGSPLYLLRVAMLYARAARRTRVLTMGSPLGQLLPLSSAIAANPLWPWLLGPVISALLILGRPAYIARQAAQVLRFRRLSADDEVIAFGAGKTLGGLMYWRTIVNQARTFGLFGFAHNTFLGTPVSVHSFPLAIAALRWLGYRGLFLLGAGLISAGLVQVFALNGHPGLAWLIPLILVSSYFIQHVSISTWEPLAWGFGTFATAFAVSGSPLLAGLFLAATIASHAGVGFLVAASAAALFAVVHTDLGSLLILGAVTFVASAWYILPFLAARNKLGRGEYLGAALPAKRWKIERIYQAANYLAFLVLALWQGLPLPLVAVGAVPVLVLILNEYRWVFSPYTISTWFLILWPCLLASAPTQFVALYVGYFLIVYTSPGLMYHGFGRMFGDDLTPVTLGHRRQDVLRLFRNCADGRIAFEESDDSDLWYTRAGVSYILSTQPLDLVNTNYAETGPSEVARLCAAAFRSTSTQAALEATCAALGVSYIVSLSAEYRAVLERGGYVRCGELDTDLGGGVNPSRKKLTLFRVRSAGPPVVPSVGVRIGINEIEIEATRGATYDLIYNCYPGWTATQGGKALHIEDLQPGIRIRSVSDDVISLRYRYRASFFRNPTAPQLGESAVY